ncbi:hypothetical protein CLAFUW4_04874 [Fulvia fulva]|uniref:Uncharacterized protein n=1 Tax=Passalora fulva TaxID=5499 RepID=A0A9Q8PHJ6_PASFU|nr:uncharacterized protein CLAFUR5_12031 [Fulvia fulva]KAK4627158.1 hypothetical protein CLAFUR4_04860 [Fulvia fulva]KAK4628107.1 hypothetical protein CLAFUR0_04864 [Fulvia fulva]UJO22635.1 hypothetical protein CLAFUR5_12031 [Fulvia fulva]WPV13389.1 hypothetical protein CLAFUW4_04874 [Fulvia fulva]WPV28953.1 hypothetical protein CLAFUW7_04868 [Fulvia fulva]
MPPHKTAPGTGKHRQIHGDLHEALTKIVGKTLYLPEPMLTRVHVYATFARTLYQQLRSEDNEALDTIGYHVMAAYELLATAELADEEDEDVEDAVVNALQPSAPKKRGRDSKQTRAETVAASPKSGRGRARAAGTGSEHTKSYEDILEVFPKDKQRQPKKAPIVNDEDGQAEGDAPLWKALLKQKRRDRSKQVPALEEEGKNEAGAGDAIATVSQPKQKSRSGSKQAHLPPVQNKTVEADEAEDEDEAPLLVPAKPRGHVESASTPQQTQQPAKSTSTTRSSGRNKRKASNDIDADADAAPAAPKRSKRVRGGDLAIDGNQGMGGKQTRVPVTLYQAANQKWYEVPGATEWPGWAIAETTA